MFRSKRKHQRKRNKKQYVLHADDQAVKIPLTFTGKSAKLNSEALHKGQYTLCTQEKKEQNRIPVMVL
ncbi:hypothetical protein KUV50_04135 [Membranicola marinus]|uniref:Uncharacterized protein n=1 Tax=Membranihabitans marinus TaxID=1227546 RepID=A0A953L969_9BACT|nr:hypothetical protein [Membranihabitans marinus]MBY5957313.1 hypothetical protein [Membranihabitans marinus]